MKPIVCPFALKSEIFGNNSRKENILFFWPLKLLSISSNNSSPLIGTVPNFDITMPAAKLANLKLSDKSSFVEIPQAKVAITVSPAPETS